MKIQRIELLELKMYDVENSVFNVVLDNYTTLELRYHQFPRLGKLIYSRLVIKNSWDKNRHLSTYMYLKFYDELTTKFLQIEQDLQNDILPRLKSYAV